jgi:hypothetical protein
MLLFCCTCVVWRLTRWVGSVSVTLSDTMATAQKCAHANCNKPRYAGSLFFPLQRWLSHNPLAVCPLSHINKPYCLDHYKASVSLSGVFSLSNEAHACLCRLRLVSAGAGQLRVRFGCRPQEEDGCQARPRKSGPGPGLVNASHQGKGLSLAVV